MPAARDDSPPTWPLTWLIAGFYGVILALYRWAGWTVVGVVPEPRRFVLVAAPHTSGWDFVYYIGLIHSLRIRTHFMAKKSLFRGSFGRFLREIGGIPIERSTNQGYVQMMVTEFARREEFILTIAPEGTRRKPTQWRTGFYQIALAAKVPLVIGLMDYGRMTGGLADIIIWPTGDFRRDMAKVLEVYQNCTPKHSHRAVRSLDDICGSLQPTETPRIEGLQSKEDSAPNAPNADELDELNADELNAGGKTTRRP